MKLEHDFILEQASWPALLVDEANTIRCANQTAVESFGAIVESGTSSLNSIWSPDNEVTSEQFLLRIERLKATESAIVIKLKGGAAKPFLTYGCRINRGNERLFVLQFAKELSADAASAVQSLPTSTSAQPIDPGVVQKQKLDCAMQLIRSVVLDFNNALTSILGHTSWLLEKIEPHHPWRNSLVEVEKSAEKAAEIAHDLASFSRQEKDDRALSAGNLNDLLRRTVDVFKTPGAPSLIWNLQLESRLYAVQFDEAKLQQAFLKIIENAVQAVGAAPSICIQTQNLNVAEGLLDGTAALGPGHYVCVEVSDNGHGIPQEIMQRIFEPFFTTKPGHRGLGLAWVYGIVTNHGGSVTVSCDQNTGTAVRVYLPAQKRFVKDRAFKSDELSGNQTILMVDDEDLLLTMGEMVLSSYGYKVLTANSGEKALQIFTQMGAGIDLVITDLVMPGMGGRELLERLRKLSPKVLTICCSGYVRPAKHEEDENYLKKPFTSQELLQKVKQSLS